MSSAISLALLVGAGVIVYAWAALRAFAAGVSLGWLLAGIPVAMLAVPMLMCLFWFALAWLFRARRPEEVKLGTNGVLRLYWSEVLAMAGSIPRMIAYRWLMPDPPPAPAALPVLLLHGVLCNAGVWQPMRKYLAARGIGPIYALSYGPPLASIEHFADQAAHKIDAMLAATGARQVLIVGHSMGGLVARAYLRAYGGAKVRRVITLGTPHRGSVHAYVFPGTALTQLRPGTAWLEGLGATPTEGDAPQIVSLWSWHDSMVAPQTSSILEEAENIALTGIGHNALLSDRVVFARVAAEIESAQHDEPPLPDATP